MARTQFITIQQEALAPWADKLDFLDCALIHHVETRLTRRVNQEIIIHEKTPCVWVHYPTLLSENWLIARVDVRTIKRRFEKLARLGLLVRQQRNLGKRKGSRAYYGLATAYRARLEEIDTPQDSKGIESLEGTPMSPQYERTPVSPHSEGSPVSPQRNVLETSREVYAGAYASPGPAARAAPCSRPEISIEEIAPREEAARKARELVTFLASKRRAEL